jgi:hypothetical protein
MLVEFRQVLPRPILHGTGDQNPVGETMVRHEVTFAVPDDRADAPHERAARRFDAAERCRFELDVDLQGIAERPAQAVDGAGQQLAFARLAETEILNGESEPGVGVFVAAFEGDESFEAFRQLLVGGPNRLVEIDG